MNKTPPHDIETEKALLGAILIEPAQLHQVNESIAADDFYPTNHRTIYKAILALFGDNKGIDPVTVCDELHKAGELDAVGGAAYISELMAACPTPQMAEYYAGIIKDKSTRRRLLAICKEGVYIAENENKAETGDALATVEKKIYELARHNTSLRHSDISELIAESWDNYLNHEGEAPQYIETGFYDLDRAIDGLQDSEHIIIAGRPAMGKTSLATDICRQVAKRKQPVLFFTMEMTKRRLAERVICAEARVPIRDYRRRKLTELQKSDVGGAMNRLWKIPLTICEGQASLTAIRSKALQEKYMRGLRLIVIDYLTLIDEPKTAGMSQNDLVGNVANKLQLLSKDLNIPVITVSQLSRECERRSNKRPVLSDLRDSGNIEQAGDKVLFVYRDDYYDADTKKPGVAEIIIAKSKDGPTGMIELGWNGEATTFYNLKKGERV